MFEIKRAVLYARFSSDNQRTESIDAQVRAMKQFCIENKWKIVGVYVDEARSATTDQRPNFQRMIEDSSKNRFDIVLVHKLDRFSRNRYDSAIYKNKLKHNGVRLCSVLERLDNTPESIILESMLESMAEYYSSNLGREVMKGMLENAFQCKHTGGSAPLGYDIDENKHLVVNEHEAEAVKIIFDMYISGYSYQNIADYLNSKGYKTKAGKSFRSKTSFLDILNNEKYTGTYVFNRAESKDYNHKRNSHRNKPDNEIIRIENGCPAIISKETFQKAKERRQLNNKKCGQFHYKSFYLCSGIVVCGECGKTMGGSKRCHKQSFNVYCCKSHKSDCCNIKEIDRDKLDNFVVKLLEREVFSELSMKKRINELNRNIVRYNRTLPALKKSLNKQLDEVNTKNIDLQSIKEKTVEIYEQENALECQRNSINKQLEKLNEIDSVNFEDYIGQIALFSELKDDKIRFRTFLQDYLKSVTVYREKVVFLLDLGFGVLDDIKKEYTFERRLFKTPSQKK